jgi:hypothetical protein
LSAGWYFIDFARSRKTASLGNPARIPVSLSGCRYQTNMPDVWKHEGITGRCCAAVHIRLHPRKTNRHRYTEAETVAYSWPSHHPAGADHLNTDV